MRSLARLAERPAALGSTWAVVRTLVATSSLLTLLANHPASIDALAADLAGREACRGVARVTAACVLTAGEYTWGTHVVLVVCFLAVASGVLPRVTGLIHPLAALSLMTSLTTADGGDQAALVFSVLAVPLCLADPRRSHWAPWPEEETASERAVLRRSTVTVFTLVLRLQISLIYLEAGLAKLAVHEWAEGTALYYWTIDGYLPPPTFAEPLVGLIATTPLLLLGATYGTLVLELLLGVSLLLRPARLRAALLATALLFHLVIALTFAIWSFALTMAALVTFLLSPTRFADWRPLVRGAAAQRPVPPAGLPAVTR